MAKTVKIYGYGWVGKSMHKLFPDAYIYDPAAGYKSKKVCDVAFVCVPTPNLPDGSLDTSIVRQVVEDAKEGLIIIRSTVNPGTCESMQGLSYMGLGSSITYTRKIAFMPEYLGETVAHPLSNDTEAKFLIIGGRPAVRREVIELFQGVYNANIKIRQLSLLEAEVVKLSENRAIMFKVAQSQELYDVCEAAGVDYYTIREAVYGDDPRFNLLWTFVYPDKRGADSKCIPKDVLAWREWAKSADAYPWLTDALLKYNSEMIYDA